MQTNSARVLQTNNAIRRSSPVFSCHRRFLFLARTLRESRRRSFQSVAAVCWTTSNARLLAARDCWRLATVGGSCPVSCSSAPPFSGGFGASTATSSAPSGRRQAARRTAGDKQRAERPAMCSVFLRLSARLRVRAAKQQPQSSPMKRVKTSLFFGLEIVPSLV